MNGRAHSLAKPTVSKPSAATVISRLQRLADLQADGDQPWIRPVDAAPRRELALGTRNGAPPDQQRGQPRDHRDRQEKASHREAGGQGIETLRQQNEGRKQPKVECDRA